MSKKITSEKELEIVDFYKRKPITIRETSEKFKYSIPTIIKVLNKFKVKRYSKIQLFSPELKENYFEDINTEYKAYFLGLIITDGCLLKKEKGQNLVNLTLQEKDKYIIEALLKDICSNKIPTPDGRGCYSVNIISNKMVSDLEKYGLKENKSLSTIFPTNIPNNLYSHLIRGIFDGDGSFSFYVRKDRKSHTKAIRLCQGNKKFLEDIIIYLYENKNIEKINLFREKDNLWSFAYRKNDSMMKLISFLYDDASIFIKRKKEIADKIKNEIVLNMATPR